MEQVDELRATLKDEGVVLMRGVLAIEPLTSLRDAASRCFEAIESGAPVRDNYCFNRHAHSVLLTALLDFGIENEDALWAPLLPAGLGELFADLVGERWRCGLEHSWARKKFAPRNAPPSGYHIQDWHQDGALGAKFPVAPGPAIPPARMATCWIPLDPCGTEAPGLEFIRKRQPALLHFTELDEGLLRQRFEAAAFWAPELEFGDVLVFSSDVLHRTHLTPSMRADRMSVEYRIFPEQL